jgi:hypothetical protein
MAENDKDFAGKNGFTWWVGVVEDRQDPLKMGRVRVRAVGWNADNKMQLPTDQLPWAMPMLPVNNTNPYAPKEGDMVIGFFTDGEAAQEPVIMGVFPGIALKAANAQEAFADPRTGDQLTSAPVKPNESATGYPRRIDEPSTSRLARNEKIDDSIVSLKKAKKADKVEPDPYYAAKYPYNNVHESESGHALEFDDTKDAERVHLYHRSGSYIEWGPAGDRAERIEKDKFTVVIGNDSIYVKGDVAIYVDGNVTADIKGDVKATIGGGVNMNVTGDVNATTPNLNLTGDLNVTGQTTVSKNILVGQGITTGTGGGGGNMTVNGSASFTGDVVAQGTSLHTHTHSDPQGGNTGPPV